MEEYKIDDEFLNEVREQFRLWAFFLNNGIGLLAFTLAIASLGSTIPWVNAMLSIIVIFIIRWQGKHYFPHRLKKIREEAKEDKKAKILLKGIESEFLGTKNLIFEYPIFLIGFIFLITVAASPLLAKAFPFSSSFFGI